MPVLIDAHAHLSWRSPGSDWEARDDAFIDAADRLGIDRLCCSILTPTRPSDPDGFRQANDWAADGMARYPGRVLAWCYVNPGWGREALAEIRRRVEDDGFIGVKLYNEYFANEPVLFPVVELCIELGVPILHHAGHSHYYVTAQPRMSDGGNIAELSERYPEAMLICGHIGGGGDWEWTIKALRDAPSVFLDTSGSVIDEGMIEMAARVLGAHRLLFACDMSMTAGVGKMRGARLTDEEKSRIFGENMQGILARRGRAGRGEA